MPKVNRLRPTRLAPALITLLCLLPLLVGLGALLLPAFGFQPALGKTELSLDSWRLLWQQPGLLRGIQLSLITGFGSTLLSLLIALSVLSLLWQTRWWRAVTYLLSPLLALPHVAFAIGLAFVVSPSGWLARLFTAAFDWSSPPLWPSANDAEGRYLLLLLTIKGLPFLILMALSAISQLAVSEQLLAARALGYDRIKAWWTVVIPQLVGKLKLPLFALLVYGLTVVDIALITGPLIPPTLAVMIFQWFSHPDLSLQLVASCGALLLLIITGLSLLLWQLGAKALAPLLRLYQLSGQRRAAHPLIVLGNLVIPTATLLSVLSFASLFIWSFARRWRFPDMLPGHWSLDNWLTHAQWLAQPLGQSLLLALASSLVALLLCLLLLERQMWQSRRWPTMLICAGLLAPQLSLYLGLQAMLGDWLADSYWLCVCWGHLLMVFPYIFLSLHGPYRAYDKRYQLAGLSFGHSPTRVFWQIKVPMLLPAILAAWAVGFGVSVVQYLPTQILGAGRIATITTEAVAIGSGQDRRLAAVYGLAQSLLPLLAYYASSFASRFASTQPRRD